MPSDPTPLPETPRQCSFCTLPIPNDEKAVHAKKGNALAHFECWYGGVPIRRDPQTGEKTPRAAL